MKPDSSRKTMCAPLSSASFFYARELVSSPTFDLLFVTLSRSTLGSLAGPSQPFFQYVTNMFAVIPDAKVPLDDLRDPTSRPQVVVPSKGGGPFSQQGFQLPMLIVGQAAWATRMWNRGKPLGPCLCHIFPSVDGVPRDSQNPGDDRGRFPLVEKLHGTAPPPLQLFCVAFGSHRNNPPLRPLSSNAVS
jgi:hypothetical protein